MTRHDRLMNALNEIEIICSKNVDDILGCGRKCPFLLGTEQDNYRPCEVMEYIGNTETPDEWGAEEGE